LESDGEKKIDGMEFCPQKKTALREILKKKETLVG